MKQTRILFALAALCMAAVLAACGGGGGNNNKNGSNNTGNGGGNAGSQQTKQFNTLHVAHNAIAGHSLQVNMGQQNSSGQTGNASVVDKNGGVNVAIHIKSEPKGASEPAHIHKGSCTKLDPVPYKPLNPVVNGSSMTFVKGVTVAQLKAGKYAINVHKSANDLKTYVSCGDLQL